MARSQVTITNVYDAVQDLRKEIQENYVTKVEFTPVKNFTYGLVTLIISAVLTALVATVVKAF
jgi:ABC-type phosphate transport system permease subunit